MRISITMLGLMAALWTSGPAWALDPIYTGYFSSTALDGYDAVAYFTEGLPTKGSSEFETEWRGATWRFSSREHQEAFQADPERYAPQYGGYCAYAIANGVTAPGDPQVWRIVDEKLFLNVNESVGALWAKDIPGYIAQADKSWPLLIAE